MQLGPNQPRSSPGFALLSVLLIVGLVMVAVAGLLSVAATSASLAHSDEAGSAALGVADQGLARGLERLRWGWTIAESPLVGQAADGGEYSIVSTAIAPGSPLWLAAQARLGAMVPASTFCVCELAVAGSSGQGRRTIHAVVAVTPDALPRGLVVGADVSVTAPLELMGCGLYAGGNVTGRERVALEPPNDSAASSGGALPDYAYGGLYESAAVHAGGAIFTDDGEVHDPRVTGFAGDDDAHSGGGPARVIVTPLNGLELSALWAHASDPGPAWAAGRLSIDLLPPDTPATDEPTCPGSGLIVVIEQPDTITPVIIEGDRSRIPSACPVTIVVLGDCKLAQAASATGRSYLEGALVVTGRLTTVGPTVVRGSVFAGSLDCRASLTVDASGLAGPMGQESTPGSSNVSIVSWSD